MKILKYKYNPEKKGVYRISIVESPAVGEGSLVLMSAQEMNTEGKEFKGVFYAPVMIPDLKIQRVGDNGEPYMVYYDAETVEQLSWNYWKQCGNRSTNLDHDDDDEEGIYPVESWIVKNPEEDKSKALGMPLQKIGTWIMGYKADNPEVLQKIKDKLLQGLSIEGFLDAEEELSVKFNKQEMEKTILEKMGELLGLIKMSSEEGKEKTPEEIEAEKKAEMDDQEKEVIVADDEDKAQLLKDFESAKAVIIERDNEIADLKAKLAKYENDATLMSAQLTKVEEAFTSYKAVQMSSQKLGDQPRSVKKFEEMTPLEKFRANK